MIRPATLDDLVYLGLFCLECHWSMPWREHGLEMGTESVLRRMLNFMLDPMCDLSVVDLGHGIAGACAVQVAPNGLDPRQLVASEWMWHMRPNFPDGVTKRKWVVRMLNHMMDFSRRAGADIFKANTIHGDTALVSLLERRGILPMETACVGRL